MKWAELFCEEVTAKGVICDISIRVNGWPETMLVGGNKCFSKSVTFNTDRSLYFQGVDPKKLSESGDYVLICGGHGDSLRDIFIIPWHEFFEMLSHGEPVNTYRYPKEYWQYKFKIQQNKGSWYFSVQGFVGKSVNISNRRYSIEEAINMFQR